MKLFTYVGTQRHLRHHSLAGNDEKSRYTRRAERVPFDRPIRKRTGLQQKAVRMNHPLRIPKFLFFPFLFKNYLHSRTKDMRLIFTLSTMQSRGKASTKVRIITEQIETFTALGYVRKNPSAAFRLSALDELTNHQSDETIIKIRLSRQTAAAKIETLTIT